MCSESHSRFGGRKIEGCPEPSLELHERALLVDQPSARIWNASGVPKANALKMGQPTKPRLRTHTLPLLDSHPARMTTTADDATYPIAKGKKLFDDLLNKKDVYSLEKIYATLVPDKAVPADANDKS